MCALRPAEGGVHMGNSFCHSFVSYKDPDHLTRSKYAVCRGTACHYKVGGSIVFSFVLLPKSWECVFDCNWAKRNS